ncbi:MAG: acyl carrier protein [Pseudomonadota bacterium]
MTELALPPSHEEISKKVIGMLADNFNMDPSEVSTTQSLNDYGLDSLDAVIIAADIEEWLGIELPATLLWDCENVDEVADYVIKNFAALARGEEVVAMS